MAGIELKKDVVAFSDKCDGIVGDYEADSFSVSNWMFLNEQKIQSPIEQIFYLSFKTLLKVNSITIAEPINVDGKNYIFGCGITPQCVIGKYRVDFMAHFSAYPIRNKDGERTQECRNVIVECDSQQFHERNESERRYEKERDRFLQKDGFKILHYTGSEIVKKPFTTAADVLSYLVSSPVDDLYNINFIPQE